MRIILRLGALVLALLFLLCLSLALFWWWFDPEDYREAMGEELSVLLGQPVTVEGRIHATFLPRPSVEIGGLRLQNPDGFEQPLFAEARELRMELDVPPLLGGRVRLAELELEGLALQLERNHDGSGSWEVLAESVSFDRLGDAGMLQFEGLRGIRIGTVEIGWSDRQEGRHGQFSLSEARLTGVQPGQDGELVAEWQAGWDDEISGEGSLALGFQLDDRYLPVAFAVHQAGGRIMARELDEALLSLRLEAELGLDLAAREFALSDFRLISRDLVADMQAEGRWTNDGSEVTGWLTVADDGFRDTLRRILRTEPDTEDPDSLRRLRVQTMFGYGNRRLDLRDISVQLDDSLLEGSSSYSWQAVPLWEFDASLDYLQLDRYTPKRFDPDTVRAVLPFLLD
ncbi:MAG: AsmA family protein, partial [Ectothiorhodospiraceae bacterium]|nr:AsmA family protein [Ectothiorhodospiraceae bacterium]